MGTWNDSFEAQMLESMKRSVEEDMKEPDEEDGETSDDVEYKVDFDDSFGVSWSTYQHPPPMNPQVLGFFLKMFYFSRKQFEKSMLASNSQYFSF